MSLHPRDKMRPIKTSPPLPPAPRPQGLARPISANPPREDFPRPHTPPPRQRFATSDHESRKSQTPARANQSYNRPSRATSAIGPRPQIPKIPHTAAAPQETKTIPPTRAFSREQTRPANEQTPRPKASPIKAQSSLSRGEACTNPLPQSQLQSRAAFPEQALDLRPRHHPGGHQNRRQLISPGGIVALVDPIVRKARFRPPRQRMLTAPEIVAHLKPIAVARRIVPNHQLKSFRLKPSPTTCALLLTHISNFF